MRKPVFSRSWPQLDSGKRAPEGAEGRAGSFNPAVIDGSLYSPPEVRIQPAAIQKILAYADFCPVEINGFGIVKRLEGNKFLITDAFILPQTVSSISADMDDLAYNRFIVELVQNGLDPYACKLQWHSHVDAPAFFSPKDLRTIRGYLTDFMISLVVNRWREYQCRIDVYKPFPLSLDVPVLAVLSEASQEVLDGCIEDIRAKVKRRRRIPFLGEEVVPESDRRTDAVSRADAERFGP
ncbi:MAG: hypothetical protein A2939_02870 [Parcubacteria group bacterium RIFCSPLOWO2_01_FULL_48_18]|nr:MAG: hypothetical protein A2939_02870 [Parcubacteria group bacterium RIFCSPLOWO2_01_FULL_48_18]OHB23026.1 MAG: hypothetical protein A3J67_04020 [Parcubacteria group bacterium RIFCSPHIGHO2_02_FULL_48_10b]